MNDDGHSRDSGFDSNGSSSSESILSFASRSSDEETDFISSNDNEVCRLEDVQDLIDEVRLYSWMLEHII